MTTSDAKFESRKPFYKFDSLRVLRNCVVPKTYTYPSTVGTFVLDSGGPPPPPPPRGGLFFFYPPPPPPHPRPGISVIFQLGWVPPGRYITIKMPSHNSFMRKVIVSAIKREKNLFIYVDTVSNNLNFAL